MRGWRVEGEGGVERVEGEGDEGVEGEGVEGVEMMEFYTMCIECKHTFMYKMRYGGSRVSSNFFTNDAF